MLAQLIRELELHPAIIEKWGIERAYAPAVGWSHDIALGDDCAAIPDPASGGYLLFAAEGMLESFVADDPWFAGYSAVMVNLSDVASMGGRAIAITDVLWTPDCNSAERIWQGMRAAAEAYGVPIVGGHTTYTHTAKDKMHLAASVLGRAGKHLLTSFDVEPGDHLVIAIDMNGAYRRDKPFWNASTTANPEHLRSTLELLPQLAEMGLCKAAKDISNGGIIGTLAMLNHSSGVGVKVDLEKIPIPPDTDWLKWLTSFPSFGYLLAVKNQHLAAVQQHFQGHAITTADVGIFTSQLNFILSHGSDSEALTGDIFA
jgi:uncharacterized protein